MINDPYHSLYIGLKCQHCSRPIMTKKDMDHITELYRDRNQAETVKTLLRNLKCRECSRDVSDQVIWNYQEFLAKELHDWMIKNHETFTEGEDNE